MYWHRYFEQYISMRPYFDALNKQLVKYATKQLIGQSHESLETEMKSYINSNWTDESYVWHILFPEFPGQQIFCDCVYEKLLDYNMTGSYKKGFDKSVFQAAVFEDAYEHEVSIGLMNGLVFFYHEVGMHCVVGSDQRYYGNIKLVDLLNNLNISSWDNLIDRLQKEGYETWNKIETIVPRLKE